MQTKNTGEYGVYSLLPVAAVLLTAVLTKRPFEAMIFGNIIAILILAPTDFFNKTITVSLDVLADLVTGWLLLLTLLFGAFIALLHLSGGVTGFIRWLSGKVTNKKQLL